MNACDGFTNRVYTIVTDKSTTLYTVTDISTILYIVNINVYTIIYIHNI